RSPALAPPFKKERGERLATEGGRLDRDRALVGAHGRVELARAAAGGAQHPPERRRAGQARHRRFQRAPRLLLTPLLLKEQGQITVRAFPRFVVGGRVERAAERGLR